MVARITTLEELQQLGKRIVAAYSQRDARLDEEERAFLLQYDASDFPQKAEVVTPPTAYQIIRDFQVLLTAKLPAFYYLGTGETVKDEERHARVNRFLQAFWDNQSLSHRRIYEDMVYYLLLRGHAVVRVLFDDSDIPELPERPEEPPLPPSLDPATVRAYIEARAQYEEARRAYEEARRRRAETLSEKFPIRLDVIDPRHVYPDLSNPPRFLFIKWRRPLSEVLEKWPEVEMPPVAAADAEVEWWEYWDEHVYAYWVELVKGAPAGRFGNGRTPPEPYRTWVVPPTPHNLGLFPFVIDGPYPIASGDPANRYRGALSDILPILKQEFRILSQYATLTKHLAWPHIIYRGGRYTQLPDSLRNMQELQITPLDVDEDIQYLVPQVPLQYLDAMQAYLQGYLMRSAVGPGAFGRQSARSAAQQAMLAAQARLVVLPYERAMERLLAKVSSIVLRYIDEHWRGRITVVGLYGGEEIAASISPSDIDGTYAVRVQMHTPLYEEMMAKLPLVQNLMAMRLISRDTAADMLGLENPQEELLRIIFESVYTHPALMQFLLVEAMQRYWPEALPLLLHLMQQGPQQQQQQQTVPGTPGRPPAPGQPGGTTTGEAMERQQLLSTILAQLQQATTPTGAARRSRPRRPPRQMPGGPTGAV